MFVSVLKEELGLPNAGTKNNKMCHLSSGVDSLQYVFAKWRMFKYFYGQLVCEVRKFDMKHDDLS